MIYAPSNSELTIWTNTVFCRALAKVVAKVWLLQAYFATKKARLFNAAVRPAKLKSYAGAGRTAYLVILFRYYPNPRLTL